MPDLKSHFYESFRLQRSRENLPILGIGTRGSLCRPDLGEQLAVSCFRGLRGRPVMSAMSRNAFRTWPLGSVAAALEPFQLVWEVFWP